MAFTPLPRALGAGVAASEQPSTAESGVRALGASMALSSSMGSIESGVRALGAGIVLAQTIPTAELSVPRALGASLVLETSDGGSFVPLVAQKPFGLGAGLVLSQGQDVVQFDETDHMRNRDWRDRDFTRIYDYQQLLGNERALATLFDVAHDAVSGVHAPIGLSEFETLTTGEVVLTLSGLATNAYVTTSFSTAATFRSVLISPKDVTNANPIECVTVWASANAVLHGFRALSGGSVTATIKSWLYADPSKFVVASALLSEPDTYDAALAGLAWTKNHYNQVFSGVLSVLSIYAQWHARASGAQRTSFNRGFVVASYTGNVTAGAAGTSAYRLVAPINLTSPDVWVHYAHPASGSVVVRTGFDDASVYAVTETLTGTPGAVPITSMSIRVPGRTPGAYALSLSEIGSIYHEAAADAAAQIHGNLVTLVRTFAQEHNALTGDHELPVSSVKGYRVALSGSVTAPSAIGDEVLVAIEANANIGAHHVYLPRLVGAAGSGIVAASIVFSQSTVSLLLRRVTTGTTNAFTAVVVVVDDA